MKRLQFLAAVIAAMSVNANATSYISLGDVVNVNAADRGRVVQIEGVAHFDEVFDSWDVALTYSQGLECLDAYQLEGTQISYFDAQGDVQPYIVPMHVSNDCSTVICESTVSTYWLVDGQWRQFGFARWAPGDHRVFMLVVYISPDFEGGSIDLSTIMRLRQGRNTGYTVESQTQTRLVLVYEQGDVNGDGEVNIADINALIDIILTDATETRADVNADGDININDVTALINVMI